MPLRRRSNSRSRSVSPDPSFISQRQPRFHHRSASLPFKQSRCFCHPRGRRRRGCYNNGEGAVQSRMTVWRHSNTSRSSPSYRFQSSASSLSSSPSPPVSSSASRSPSLSSGNSGGAHHAHQPFPAPLFAGNARRDAHEENFDDNGLSNNFASDSESGI